MTDDAIDWERFWATADDDKRGMAATGQYGDADRLDRFFEEVYRPDTLGSIGCGPAHAERTIADRHPDVEVYCYDTARSVVEEAREATDLPNVRFGVATLPETGIDRRFDLVYCFATLFYVAEIERAVEHCYDLVREGGYLVFDYPNRLTPAAHREAVENADDPEWFRERFALVLGRENLLSYDRIHELLGRWPRSYSSVVGDGSSRAAPQVFVPK